MGQAAAAPGTVAVGSALRLRGVSAVCGSLCRRPVAGRRSTAAAATRAEACDPRPQGAHAALTESGELDDHPGHCPGDGETRGTGGAAIRPWRGCGPLSVIANE